MKYSKPKQGRYTEASLVKQLEKLGIGRLTYSNMVSIIQNRGYTEKSDIEGDKRKIDIFKMDKVSEIKKSHSEIKIGGERNNLFQPQLEKLLMIT